MSGRILPLYGEERRPAPEWEQKLFAAETVEEVEAIIAKYKAEKLVKSGPLSGAFGDKKKRNLKQVRGLKAVRGYKDSKPAFGDKKKRRRKKAKSERPVLSSGKRPIAKRDIRKHYGPGPHESGTPQSVHGAWSHGLSAAQIVSELTNTEGFTIHYPTGVRPSEGWAVALGGHEDRRAVDSLNPEWVRRYKRRYEAELRDSETSLGGWIEPNDEGVMEAFLDVSKPIISFKEALEFARSSNQIAIFNLGTFEYLYLDNEERIAELLDEEVGVVDIAARFRKRLIIGFTRSRSAAIVNPMSTHALAKHYGPGPHPSGSPQDVHGAGMGGGGVVEHPASDSIALNASDEVLGETESRHQLPSWFEGRKPSPGEFWVNDTKLDEVRKKITSLNKRGAKHGLEPFTMEVVGQHEQLVKELVGETPPWGLDPDQGVRETVQSWSLIKVTGTPPTFEGWEFAARIEHLPTVESGGEALFNILHTRPDLEAIPPDMYRDRGPECDVCQRNVYRKDTFLVHNTETGEWKQVGRDDLTLFTGARNPAADQFYLKVWDDMEGDEDDFFTEKGFGNAYIGSSETYLARVAAEVREHGYVSANSLKDDYGDRTGNGLTTAEIVQDSNYYKDKWGDRTPKVTDADVALAAAARAHYAAYETPENVKAYQEFESKWREGWIAENGDTYNYESPELLPPDPERFSPESHYWREGSGSEDYSRQLDEWKATVAGTEFDPTGGAEIKFEIIDSTGVEVAHYSRSLADKNMRDLYQAQRNDQFMLNMKAAALTPYATRSNAGLMAYIVPGYQKHLAQVELDAIKAAKPKSEWVGTVGTRQRFDLKVYEVKSGWKQTNYGDQEWVLTKATDSDGNLIHSFYSGQAVKVVNADGYEENWKPGVTIHADAKVKSHEIDKYADDQKVTWIERLTKVEVEQP